MSAKNGRRECRPWFQMYPTDYFGSPKVARMNAEERGVYTTIMFRSWTDDGYVLDMDDLADELDISSKRLAEIMAGRVGRALYEDEDGRLRSARLEEERTRAMSKAEIAAENGKKGGRPRKKPSVTQRVSDETQPLAKETQPQPSVTQLGPNVTQPELSCAELSCASTSPSLDTSQVVLPEGALAPAPAAPPVVPKVQRGKLLPTQLEMLAQEFQLDPVVTQAFEAWRTYRIEIGKQLTQSSARRLAKKAAEDPELFTNSVGHSIEQGFQGLYPPKGDQGQAVAVNGGPLPPHKLPFNALSDLYEQKRIEARDEEVRRLDAAEGDARWVDAEPADPLALPGAPPRDVRGLARLGGHVEASNARRAAQ